MWKRVNLCVVGRVSVDAAETREGVLPVDVHCTRATNALSARTPKGQCRVDLVLDLDECIKDLPEATGSETNRCMASTCHGTGLV